MSAVCIQCGSELNRSRFVLCAATERAYACLCAGCAEHFQSREAAFERLEQLLGVHPTPEQRQALALQDATAVNRAAV